MTVATSGRTGTSPVRLDRVRVPFRRPFATSAGVWAARESWIVRVRGAGGVGAAEVPVETGDLRLRTLVEALEDRRLGAAMADAAAAAERPRGGLDVGVNATLEAGPIDDLIADARAAVALGFGTLKVKVGAEAGSQELAERIGALRAAVGGGVRLRLDANGAWEPSTAVERLAAVARFDIEVVEQPVPVGEPAELALVRARSGVPIAADEAVASVAAAEALLLASAVDALVVKPGRVGGLGAARRIGELAYSAGIPVVLSTLFETGIGVAGALGVAAGLAAILPPGVAALDHGLATLGLLEDDLLAEPIRVEAGRARVGALLPDDAAIERYRIAEPLADGWGT